VAIFHGVVNNVGQSYHFQEKGTPDYIPSTSADRSTGPHPISLPLTAVEAVGVKPSICCRPARSVY
jgi:hypothetical protein